MYVGVDIGGTKTLLAVLNEHGVIKEEKRFPTPTKYDNFLLELKHALSQLEHQDFKAGAVAIRGMVDRQHGRPAGDDILQWTNKPLEVDVERIFKCPMILENDAKLAALSEAMLLKNDYKRVVYITISTGIGYAMVINGVLDINTNDGAGQSLLLEHRGKMVAWEDFAGGKAIVERYGKQAKDIHDAATWKLICRDLAQGIIHIMAMMQPEVIVIGGSVGVYFDRYSKILKEEVAKYKVPLVGQPDFRQAQRPEQAVIFGCYDAAKQRYGHD